MPPDFLTTIEKENLHLALFMSSLPDLVEQGPLDQVYAWAEQVKRDYIALQLVMKGELLVTVDVTGVRVIPVERSGQ